MKKRCHWVTDQELYIRYHDEEWGRPLTDSRALFELLCLEGQQAGLSWWTVLQKREAYRQHFAGFDPHAIVQMAEADVDRLCQEPSIIRHRLKIESIIKNAQAYLRLEEEGKSFSSFIWSFVDGHPHIHHPRHPADIPTQTPSSEKMSRELKKAGFTFVGPVICYAFMQAAGLVNDHESSCFLTGNSL